MKFAEVFPPGEFLKEELEARDWTQIEFADILGRPPKLVNEIVLGKRAITPETAVQIGEALGTGPELWMNLESQYQLSKVQQVEKNSISRKAKIHAKFPAREMIKRGWIQVAESLDVLENQFLDFFGIESIDAEISFSHSAKRSSAEPTILQYTWLFAAAKLAKKSIVPVYSEKALRDALPHLKALMSAPEEVRHIPRILSECGVRFVVVEPLPSSKIDGACFWLEGDQPAIAISTRLDRIDNFWFVLRHEIEHVLRGHGKDVLCIFDEDIFASSELKSDEEKEADLAAGDFGISAEEIDNYISRVKPYYFSEQKILNFSARVSVHPGIILGRLQNKFRDDPKVWTYNRSMLVKVRGLLIASAPYDGWGNSSAVD